MSESPQRLESIRTAVQWARILALVGVAGLVVVGGYLFIGDGDPQFRLKLLAIGIVAGAVILAAGVILFGHMVNLLLKIEGNSFRSYGVLRDMDDLLEKQKADLTIIAENSELSDAVRAVTHRSRERTALRLAINEEIIRGDLEAAYALVEQLESRHGYRNEAARIREEVDQSRLQQSRDELNEAVEIVRKRMEAHDWDWSRREMDRLGAEHPENPEVRGLPALFSKLRSDHKRRLLKAWDESVQRNEVDRGIAILKELDQFLTPNEAAALEESARGVFRAKLHNLGVQFSLAVTSQDWQVAYNVGQEITREFPNSRMAQEVKDRIHVLAQRAGGPLAEPASAVVAQD
jgi:hypothetical protein